MSLNPVKFGKDVIDQFGRYLRNSYPIAYESIAEQFNEKMAFTSDSLIAKGPYIYLNKPFVEGAELDTLIKELGLHKALDAIFKFPIMWLVAVQKRICISTFRLDLINHLLQVLSKTQVRMKYHNRNLGGHFDVRCS